MIIEVLAWSGALLSSLLSVPQLVRAVRSERLDGLSAGTYWLVLGNATIWATWAVLTGQYAAGAGALVNGPAAVLILIRLHHSHASRSQPTSQERREHGPTSRSGVAAPATSGSRRESHR